MQSAIAFVFVVLAALPQGATLEKKATWRPVEFAIVRFNEEAPKSWNLYHTEKKGVLLLKLWKRFLLLDMREEEVYEVDPQTVKQQGDNVEWSMADLPNEPIEISEFKSRNMGLVQRVRFRFGKNGHFLEIQLPLKPDGKPAY